MKYFKYFSFTLIISLTVLIYTEIKISDDLVIDDIVSKRNTSILISKNSTRKTEELALQEHSRIHPTISPLEKFKSVYPTAIIQMDETTSNPTTIYGFISKPYSGNPEEIAKAFINDHASLFNINTKNLKYSKSFELSNETQVVLQQYYKDVSIYGGSVSLFFNSTGEVNTFNSSYQHIQDLQITPKLSINEVYQIVSNELNTNSITLNEHELTIFNNKGSTLLTWKLLIQAESPYLSYEFLVDTTSGVIIRKTNLTVIN